MSGWFWPACCYAAFARSFRPREIAGPNGHRVFGPARGAVLAGARRPGGKKLDGGLNRLLVAVAAFVMVAVGVAARAGELGAGNAPRSITVDSAAQMRFGVAVTTLQAASAPTGTSTTARVLDPGPLLKLDSELAAASAAFAASRAEAARTRKLYTEDRTASARAVEAASAQSQADLQRVNTAHRQLALDWGGGLADLTAHERAQLLDELAHARAELVRVEVPTGVPVPAIGSAVEVRGNAPAETYAGEVLGVLPTADPRLQTRGVLVELKGDGARLPIGAMLAAEVPASNAANVTGVVLPRAALLRRDSRVWVFVQTSPVTFVRREVRDYHPMLSGWFVGVGFAPGDRVVAAGAAALLGVESPAPAEADADTD